MVMFGMLMAATGIIFLLFNWRWKYLLERPWWLKILVFLIPIGFIALEAGWVVTEVGRQPWIIYKIMRTEDAVTSMPGIVYPLILITAIYILLTFLSFYLMQRQIRFMHESMDKK
jgi:cytochrome d ubiquinol oxidase subunit I